MKDALLPIYRAVAEGRLTQAEALVRIRALKQPPQDAGPGALLATLDWAASPASGSGAQAPDRILLWGVDTAAAAALKAQRPGTEVVEFAPLAAAMDETFAHAALQALAAIQSMLAGGAQDVRALAVVAGAAVADAAPVDTQDVAVASGLEAMFRTAMEETPALTARVVRVPADISAAELQRLVADESSADAPRGAAVRHVRQAGVLQREIAQWRVLEQGSAGQVPAAAPVASACSSRARSSRRPAPRASCWPGVPRWRRRSGTPSMR